MVTNMHGGESSNFIAANEVKRGLYYHQNGKINEAEEISDFSRLISEPLYKGNLGARFRTHTDFLSLCAGLDFPTRKLDSTPYLCVA